MKFYGGEDKFLCYDCNQKERHKKYRNNHKKEIKEYDKEYYKNHKKGQREYDKEYYKNHKEEKKGYNKEYDQNGAKNPRIKITLEDAVAMVQTAVGSKKITASECLHSLGVSWGKFRSFLNANDLSMDEIAEMAGVEFAQGKGGGIGNNETEILDQQEKIIGRKIIRQYHVDIKGKNIYYRIDGYDPIAKIAREVDELHHGRQRVEDAIRENDIKAELGCTFIRIQDK